MAPITGESSNSYPPPPVHNSGLVSEYSPITFHILAFLYLCICFTDTNTYLFFSWDLWLSWQGITFYFKIFNSMCYLQFLWLFKFFAIIYGFTSNVWVETVLHQLNEYKSTYFGAYSEYCNICAGWYSSAGAGNVLYCLVSTGSVTLRSRVRWLHVVCIDGKGFWYWFLCWDLKSQ